MSNQEIGITDKAAEALTIISIAGIVSVSLAGLVWVTVEVLEKLI